MINEEELTNLLAETARPFEERETLIKDRIKRLNKILADNAECGTKAWKQALGKILDGKLYKTLDTDGSEWLIRLKYDKGTLNAMRASMCMEQERFIYRKFKRDGGISSVSYSIAAYELARLDNASKQQLGGLDTKRLKECKERMLGKLEHYLSRPQEVETAFGYAANDTEFVITSTRGRNATKESIKVINLLNTMGDFVFKAERVGAYQEPYMFGGKLDLQDPKTAKKIMEMAEMGFDMAEREMTYNDKSLQGKPTY